jgi:hypothetical protein
MSHVYPLCSTTRRSALRGRFAPIVSFGNYGRGMVNGPLKAVPERNSETWHVGQGLKWREKRENLAEKCGPYAAASFSA